MQHLCGPRNIELYLNFTVIGDWPVRTGDPTATYKTHSQRARIPLDEWIGGDLALNEDRRVGATILKLQFSP
jgi:hypothetical protein